MNLKRLLVVTSVQSLQEWPPKGSPEAASKGRRSRSPLFLLQTRRRGGVDSSPSELGQQSEGHSEQAEAPWKRHFHLHRTPPWPAGDPSPGPPGTGGGTEGVCTPRVSAPTCLKGPRRDDAGRLSIPTIARRDADTAYVSAHSPGKALNQIRYERQRTVPWIQDTSST